MRWTQPTCRIHLILPLTKNFIRARIPEQISGLDGVCNRTPRYSGLIPRDQRVRKELRRPMCTKGDAVGKGKSMKPIIRIPLAMLVTTAVISLGLIGVHASEQCVRFIQKKRHRVSAATADRWATWDKAHPNWHPKPVHEALAAIDFACSVPLIQKPVDGELPPLDLKAFDLPMGELPPPVPPTVVAENQPPPVLFPDTPALP